MILISKRKMQFKTKIFKRFEIYDLRFDIYLRNDIYYFEVGVPRVTVTSVESESGLVATVVSTV